MCALHGVHGALLLMHEPHCAHNITLYENTFQRHVTTIGGSKHEQSCEGLVKREAYNGCVCNGVHEAGTMPRGNSTMTFI